MTNPPFHGVYTALLSPRHADGTLDLHSLRALVAFQREHGITRFAVNGATGEFCLATPEELRQIVEIVRSEGGPATEILCGVGAAGLAGTVARARVAEQMQVQGLLLPMPYFFPYSNADLDAFSVAVAESTGLPILLYNLPQFTSGLEPHTVCRLIETTPNIVGIKDSSGSLDTVTALTERSSNGSRIIGNDSVLPEALTRGLCDGVVSGVACALPELIRRLYHAQPGSDVFTATEEHLATFIQRLNVLPTPWGVKVAVQARSVLQATFPLPVSAERKQEINDFEAWFRHWLPEVVASP